MSAKMGGKWQEGEGSETMNAGDEMVMTYNICTGKPDVRIKMVIVIEGKCAAVLVMCNVFHAFIMRPH